MANVENNFFPISLEAHNLFPQRDGVGLYIVVGGKIKTLKTPPVFSDIQENEIVNPLMFIPRPGIQGLVDSLWDCGYRPSKHEREVGALHATERHLEDMRKLVFEVKKG